MLNDIFLIKTNENKIKHTKTCRFFPHLMPLLILVLWGMPPLHAQLRKVLLPPMLKEVSGLYHAGPDSLWWLNDGGDLPQLILTDGQGQIKKALPLPAIQNRDWEDLSADNKGNFYIGDFGNNLNQRRDLRIYIFHAANGSLDSILFTLPDQFAFPPSPSDWNFDMEAFFWNADSLHLFSKNRLVTGNYFTKHYVMPARPGTNTAILRDSLRLPRRVVTAAAISPDGQEVGLLSYFFRFQLGFLPKTRTTLWLLRDFPAGYFLQGRLVRQRIPKCPVPTQYESLDFIDGYHVLIASERTPLYRQQMRKVRLKGRRPGV